MDARKIRPDSGRVAPDEPVFGAASGAAVARREVYLSTEEQVNHQATLPQRFDREGSKIEEIAGTGDHDSKGG
jgi:hypothetical protein